MRKLEIVDLGRMRYGSALAVQQRLVDQRKRGEGTDTLLFVEHPHVVTMGRNGKQYVNRNYRWELILSKYERLFTRVRQPVRELTRSRR